MVPQTSRGGTRRLALFLALLTTAAALPLVSACDKVPLLAPAGTVITIFPSSTTVPSSGEIEIIATVIERGTASSGTGTGATQTPSAGTPVQNGTLVSFTTTIGRIEPREARTHNGEVRVKFHADGATGTALITAYSGGASATNKDNPLLVGAAAAERLLLTATNQTLPANGGSTQIEAKVETTAGNPVPGIPVTFTTTSGSVSPSTAVTDAAGIARTTLTATAEATVKATAGSKSGELIVKVAARSGLNVTATDNTPNVGEPVTFTIETASNQVVTNARIDYGDGQGRFLGTVSGRRTDVHTYSSTGERLVVVTADNGENASTSVSVGGANASITATPESPQINQSTTLTVAGLSTNTQVREYRWNFGDGTTAVTGSNSTSKSWDRVNTYTVTVQVIGINGETIANPSRSVTVRP